MTLSSRRFLIAQDGVLYRLADATFTRMLRNPGSHAFPVLAGQRVRMASLIVELVGGAPVRVVRNTYAILSFNDDGHMDSDMFTRQQWALAESAVDPALIGITGCEFQAAQKCRRLISVYAINFMP
jgi:hypothetical protein